MTWLNPSSRSIAVAKSSNAKPTIRTPSFLVLSVAPAEIAACVRLAPSKMMQGRPLNRLALLLRTLPGCE